MVSKTKKADVEMFAEAKFVSFGQTLDRGILSLDFRISIPNYMPDVRSNGS